MRKHGRPEVIVTDRLRSYGAVLKEIGAAARQETGRWRNNRAENSHLPFRRRERVMLRFRRMRSLQKFAAVHASVSNHFNQERSLSSRSLFKLNRTAALAEWRQLGMAQQAAGGGKRRLVRIPTTAPFWHSAKTTKHRCLERPRWPSASLSPTNAEPDARKRSPICPSEFCAGNTSRSRSWRRAPTCRKTTS